MLIPVKGFANHRKSLLLAQARTIVKAKKEEAVRSERNVGVAPISLR